MNKVIHMSLTVVTATLLINCGGGTDSDNNTNGNSSNTVGKDIFKITKIDDTRFDINWTKNYTGYSEIGYKRMLNANSSMNGIFAQTWDKDTYNIICNKGAIVTNGFGDNMAYNCHITALKTSQEELAKKMAVDVQAQFLIDSEVLMGRTYHDGADKNYQGIDYTVIYHSDGTLTVE